MFGKIVGWLKSRERRIFRYWDGRKTRSIDPSAAWFALFNDPEIPLAARIEEALPQEDGDRDVDSMTPDQKKLYAAEIHEKWKAAENARQDILKLTRQVFGVKSYADGKAGLTLDEQESLFAEFYTYCTDLKKKPSTSRQSSSATDTGSSANGSASSNGSASNSTSKTPSTSAL